MLKTQLGKRLYEECGCRPDLIEKNMPVPDILSQSNYAINMKKVNMIDKDYART